MVSTMRKMNSLIFNKNRIILFVVLSYSISWLIWIPNVIAYNFNVSWNHSNWLHILGGLGPLTAAIITTLILDKKKQGLKKIFPRKVS